MAKNKKLLAELREKSIKELDVFVHENKKALFELRTEVALQNKAVKPHLFSEYKKNIARSLTVKREKEGRAHA
ncbi:50S ribosomal protein L29 [Chlamydia avium]|uniref:Large ribosomal subunit protein uL29 n=1 Tax=Chlamydia avium TaxID=1457141 RepID=A0ABN0MTP3_9CHLA|nr:50S ribosomal protein L29 [Chlamydia avium]EPP36326.1 ribosomal protein L29 [Chlamydia psittaci 10_743_SC13]EPP38910.1 ribosomal protein L29 [Chlamydia avium]VVT43331.1 50S ribosomal protein L29 [Chlamydia avium]